MADRLHELLQQRALIKEHLAWLEGEIAAASGGGPIEESDSSLAPTSPLPGATPARTTPASFSAAVPASLSRPTPGAPAPRAHDDADALIARLAAEEKTSSPLTKSGCWIFFFGALVALGLGGWVALRYFYRG